MKPKVSLLLLPFLVTAVLALYAAAQSPTQSFQTQSNEDPALRNQRADEYFKEAQLRAVTGDYDEATARLESILDDFPDFPRIEEVRRWHAALSKEPRPELKDLQFMYLRSFLQAYPAHSGEMEQAVRNILQAYPDSSYASIIQDARERLAAADFKVAEFYAGKGNYAGAIGRLRQIIDGYPDFSRIEDTRRLYQEYEALSGK